MKKIIINLSALIKLRQVPGVLNFLAPNLAAQWLSIEAFGQLHTRYAPRAPGLMGSFFNLSGVPWVVANLNWSLIARYKAGQLTTLKFLDELMDICSFLKTASFTDEVKDKLWLERENLISLRAITAKDALTSHDIARALIEKAWLARIQIEEFSVESAQEFRELFTAREIVFISNSNEMDILAIMNWLRGTFPELSLRDHSELNTVLQVPEQGSQLVQGGVPLTQNGSIKLYASYLQKAYKNGVSEEANLTTPSLLEHLIEIEKPSILISQYAKDRNVADNHKINAMASLAECINYLHESDQTNVMIRT